MPFDSAAMWNQTSICVLEPFSWPDFTPLFPVQASHRFGHLVFVCLKAAPDCPGSSITMPVLSPGSWKTSCYTWHSSGESHFLDYPLYRNLWTAINRNLCLRDDSSFSESSSHSEIVLSSQVPGPPAQALLLTQPHEHHIFFAPSRHSASVPQAFWQPPQSLPWRLCPGSGCGRPYHRTL